MDSNAFFATTGVPGMAFELISQSRGFPNRYYGYFSRAFLMPTSDHKRIEQELRRELESVRARYERRECGVSEYALALRRYTAHVMLGTAPEREAESCQTRNDNSQG